MSKSLSDQPVCTAQHLNHVCIAVRDIEDTLRFYRELFGTAAADIEDLEDQGVRAALVRIGGSQLELIEPTEPAGSVARFIERRGEGLHHVCFEVEDLPGTLKRLDGAGVELIDSAPRDGLSGSIAFIHPKATRGVLIELVDGETARR